MLGLPDTVSQIELAWTLASAAAIIASLIARHWACADLRFVREHYVAQGRGAHIARSFKRDVSNVTGRIVVSVAIFIVGVVAMFQAPTGRATTPAGWMIVALLFLVPFYLIWRTVGEATDRRHTLTDVARAYRNGEDL